MRFSGINLWAEGDISTVRIVEQLLNDLDEDLKCKTVYVDSLFESVFLDRLNIFCRLCNPKFDWLHGFFLRNKIPYVYYIDDNFWKLTGASDLARYYQSSDVVNCLDRYVRHADLVIVHTLEMHEFIMRRFPLSNCELLAPPFDTSLAVAAKQRLNAKESVVGYAGGYKVGEFELLEKIVIRLAGERPDIRFEFIGGITDKLREVDSVQWFPGFSNYSEYMSFKISRNWVAGLGPLLASNFSASKTNNKYREYGGCNIPGIFSDVTPYKECIVSGETGVLVENNVDSWVLAIKKIVDDRELSEKIRINASDFVQKNYSHRAVAPAWRLALERVSVSPVITLSTRMRFNYMKYYYMVGSLDMVNEISEASVYSLYRRRLKDSIAFYFFSKKTLLVSAIILIFAVLGHLFLSIES